jgi:hypothetical protein
MPSLNLHNAGRLGAVTILGVLVASGRAQSPSYEEAAAGSPIPPKATVVKLTLHPAAAPVPALKYQLLPEVRDLKPGNAALLYQRAHSQEWWGNFFRAGQAEKMGEYLEMPLRKMPREKIVLLTAPLREMDLAARREYCDWEMTPRVREDGLGLLLPDVQGFRTFGQMLALRARVEMLDGRPEQAIAGLQTGFALSRHVGDAPILINSLVGIAVAQLMLNQVEDLVQLENGPNLYWALADLPRPLIDLRRALQGEKLMVDGMFPEIRTALKRPNQPPVPLPTIRRYLDNLAMYDGSHGDNHFLFTLAAARVHPQARKFLETQGFTAEQVDALPVIQVALMQALALYDENYDEVYKWQGFPYAQARPELIKARQRFDQRRKEQPEGMYLASLLLPAVEKVLSNRVRLERRIAVMQIVEALRLHAAGPDGKLPERLEDIRAVPVPSDPVTGKAFEYSLEADRAVLYGPPTLGEPALEPYAVRYELTLVSRAKK